MSDRNQKPANMSENDVKNDIMQRWKLSYDSKNDIESKESMKLFEAPNLPQFKSRYSQSDVDEAEDKYLNMPDESLTEEVDEEYEQEEFADVKEISERNDQNPSQYEDDFDYTESKGNDDDDDNDNLNSTNLASESSCAFLRQVSKDECSSTPALSPRSYKSDSDEEVDEQEVDESIPDQKLESLVPLKLTEYSIAMNIDTGTEEFRRQISKDEYAMTPVVSPREYEASDDGGDKDDDDAVNILNNDSNIDPTPTVHLIQESLASSLRASAVGALADLALLVEKSHPTLPSSRISTHTGSPRGEISRLNAHKLPSVTSSIVTTTAISTQEPIKNAYDEVDQLVNDIKQDEKDGSSELSNVQTKPGIDTETNRLTKSNISPTRKSRPDVSQQSRLSLLRKKLTSSSSASTAVAAPTHVSKSKAMSAINTKTAITTTSPSRSKSPQVTPSKIPKPTTSLTPSSTTKATPYLTTATASTGSRVRTKQACTINEEFTSPSRLPDKKKAALTLTAAVTVATTATTSSTLVKELITAFASNEVKVDVPTVDAATTPQYQATLVEEDLMPSTTLKPVIQNLQTLESPAEFIQREKMLREEITQLKAMLFEQHLKSNTNQDQLRESAESVITEDMRSSAGLEHLVQDVANESFTSATASVMLSASKTEVLTSSYTNAPISNDNQQQASVERFKPKSMVPAADGSSVIISKSDYDRLLREYDAQELLVRGYETENRRLYALMKSKESEETFKKAQYFDEIQALNIELNRLRNQQHKESLPVDPSDSVPTIGSMDYMKSYAPPTIVPQSVATDADRLRRELALEIAVRDLKEELDTVKNDATQREETLQFDIEKLRSENSSLRETVSTLDSQIVTLSSPDHTDALFTAERTRLQKDNADLKGKLLWYSENQVLIEQVQSSRTELASVVTVLKKELIKAGYRSDAISRLITDASKSVKGGQVSSNDSQVSEIDSTDLKSPVGRKTGARTLSVNRNPSDIKKISELERIITELKDSIAKKNPDSLATLIQASSLTASFQGRQQEQLDSLKQQQQELTQAKADYELKLRSLRQEHEKVKIQYENRVQYSETQLTELSSPRSSKIRQNIPVSSLGVTSLGSGSTDTADNTESRIQSLEEELEKVRTFYARKIEEVQRKAEQKVWYYKRGVQPPVPPVDTATTDQHEYESIPVVADKVDKEKLVNKISLLESELAEALDRLAQAHNQLTSQSSYINHHLISLHTKGISSDHNIATVTATDDVSTHSRTASVNQRELHNGQTQLVEQLQDALTNVRNELVFIQNENTKAIQQHQQKNTQLASEIELLRLKLAEKPKPPQLQQFLLMEAQVRTLEMKFMRRKQDMQRTVDDIRDSSKIERSRISALHQQEIREKDEQLIRLRDEFNHFIADLQVKQSRHHVSSMAINPPPPSSHTEYDSITL